MLALLKLVPLKDWVYGAIIAGLLIGFGVYTHHERQVGAAKVTAAVAQVAHRAEIAVTAANTAAKTAESENAKTYEKSAATPAVPDLGIRCVRNSPRSGAVPQAHTVASPGTRKPAADSTTGPAFDPSGAVLTRGSQADAQIAYLQGRIHELEAQMEHGP